MLVVSDAARYMVKAISSMHSELPNMFHVTCLARLLHNCAMRIKAIFEKVDKCISVIKAILVKNRTNAYLF